MSQNAVQTSSGSSTMSHERVVYLQSKAVIAGRLNPFVVGTTHFDKKQAQRFVKEFEKMERKNGTTARGVGQED